MNSHLALIELYEYKVADLARGLEPPGGRRGVLELREALAQAGLDALLLRRFSRADRQFQALRPQRAGGGGAGFPVLAPPEPRVSPPPEQRPQLPTPEARAWDELRQLVWLGQLQERVQHFVLAARREPGHATLRVVYALTETAERALRGVGEAFPVPLADDPLLSLDDREIALQLAEALCGLLLTSEGEEAVWATLTRIRANPFPPHPDEAVLAARIEAAEREPASPAAREELIRALRGQYPQAPDPRERPAVRLACAALEHLLAGARPARPQPGGEVPERGVLYSADPLAGSSDPSEDAEELVIHLGGAGKEAYWHGLHLRWQRGGQDWQFMVDKQLALLRPSLPAANRHLKLRLAAGLLHLYHSGDYVLLRHVVVPLEALQALARQAALTARLLDPAQAFGNLRLGRALARVLRDGEIDPETFSSTSALKYAGADTGHLLTFARQGAVNLLTQTARREEADIQQVLAALTVRLDLSEQHAQALWRALQEVTLAVQDGAAAQPTALHLRANGVFEAVSLGEHPLNLHFAGQSVTLKRDYKGDLAVLVAGGSAGEKAVLHDLLVTPVADRSLVLVKWQQWVAATTLRLLPLP